MPVSVEEMMAGLSPQDREEVEHGAAEIVAANRSLRDLRKSLNVTQADLAKALDTSQANVAKIEAKDDLMVSTVVRVVEALGGKMQMVVSLPGRPTALLQLGSYTRVETSDGTAESVGSDPVPPSKGGTAHRSALTGRFVTSKRGKTVAATATQRVDDGTSATAEKGPDRVVSLASRRSR